MDHQISDIYTILRVDEIEWTPNPVVWTSDPEVGTSDPEVGTSDLVVWASG